MVSIHAHAHRVGLIGQHGVGRSDHLPADSDPEVHRQFPRLRPKIARDTGIGCTVGIGIIGSVQVPPLELQGGSEVCERHTDGESR